MKVNLAAQVFSSSNISVADALTFLEYDLQISTFTKASATTTFCKNFTDMFDLLNSRNLYNKTKTKCAITKSELSTINDKTKLFINYITSLKIRNVPVLKIL